MKNREYIVLALTLVLSLAVLVPANAQRRKKKAVAKPKVVAVEEPTEEQLARQQKVESMTQATQRIVFIDSMVVDSAKIFDHISLGGSCGTIGPTRKIMPEVKDNKSFGYMNQLKTRCVISLADKKHRTIYDSDFINDEWSQPEEIANIYAKGEVTDINYPYVMEDGSTIYFAAKGENSLGGYDIFVTRYDNASRSYLKPNNIGMPFNSEANDYMFCINEADSLGWFVTDRRQPKGKVCIYTFIYTDTYSTYADTDISEAQLKSRAAINRIADTWDNNIDIKAALRRLASLRMTAKGIADDNDVYFVVNDGRIITSITDFKIKENITKYRNLQKMKEQLRTTEKTLEMFRSVYTTATATSKHSVATKILNTEADAERLETEIAALEKQIRNSEQ